MARLLTSAAQESTLFAPALSRIVHSEQLGLTPETVPFRAFAQAGCAVLLAPLARLVPMQGACYVGAWCFCF